MMYRTIFVVCCIIAVQATEDSPRIIIIGAGPSGIAAASRLFENGFNNVTILEAENRIGGRVYTTKFGDYWVDLGGQWVHGEEGNVAFEMAWPLGVIERSTGPWVVTMLSSAGDPLPEDVASQLFAYFVNLTSSPVPDEYMNKSVGELYTDKFNEYFEDNPDIPADQRDALLQMFNLFELSLDSADDWFNVSAAGYSEYKDCKGDLAVHWKDKGYSTILDILMKKFPNPEEELPVLNNTVLNKEVSQINYNCSGGAIRVVTADGDELSADHVIVTTSLGVLKADHETLFNPQLSEAKINAIEGLEFGNVAKIYLEYSVPWWTNGEANEEQFVKAVFWTEQDRNEYANDPEKAWMLGMFDVIAVEYKPRLLTCWFAGPYARQMEEIPEEQVFQQLKELLHRVFGKTYNLTEPTAMIRTKWFTNKHFRGTYSYRSLESDRTGASAATLLEPISENENPLILFAGEATSADHYSTVHGAIETGRREAERLTKLYKDRKSETESSQS